MAALCFSPALTPFTNIPTRVNPLPKLAAASKFSRGSSIKASVMPYETSIADYTSAFSVFPAEACETIGGDSCLAEMFPEVKLKSEGKAKMTSWELFDREYLQYNDSKTVLRAEACDVLGGDFCERPYQRGVY